MTTCGICPTQVGMGDTLVQELKHTGKSHYSELSLQHV